MSQNNLAPQQALNITTLTREQLKAQAYAYLAQMTVKNTTTDENGAEVVTETLKYQDWVSD